jgi:signal transduction histidine kinase
MLDAESGIERRHRQVAVLSALLESEQLRADNRLLEVNLKNQQQDLAHNRKLRLWWASTAVASMLGCALIGYLFVLGKRRNRRLRQYEIILSRAGGLTPHAMLLFDENRCVCFANRCLLGKGDAPVIDAPLADVVPAFLLEEITVAIDKAFATTSFVSLEVVLHDADGSNQYYVDGGEAIGVTLQSIDITESRNLERQFLDGASRERRQFGDSLHEGLAQELAGIMLMLGNLSSVVKRGLPEARQLVTEISEQIARSIGSARQMAQDLAPVMIERGSLPDAVQKLTESASRRLGISMSCDCRIEGCSTSDLAADHIYQFCREAVINATLSKECRWVRIEMTVIGASLTIRINDNRRRTQTGVETDGLRTKMLVFRARLLGGALSFDATPANESCVTLKIPLSQLQEEAAADTKRRRKDVIE